MSNFWLRIIFGSLYVGIIILAINMGAVWFTSLMTLIFLLALLEGIALCISDANSGSRFTALVYAGLLLYLCIFQALEIDSEIYLYALVIQWVSLFLIRKNLLGQQAPKLLFITFYIWLPLIALALWYKQHETIAFNYLLFFFLVIWIYDSMAYLIGKSFGKRPIFPLVSPKKTFEGTVGGLVATLIITLVLEYYFLSLDTSVWLLTPLIILFATFGDYAESYLKRKMGVKDSGKLIPGHGGILDRIDSILAAALPYLVILSFS